jgi:hypothetical protein
MQLLNMGMIAVGVECGGGSVMENISRKENIKIAIFLLVFILCVCLDDSMMRRSERSTKIRIEVEE